MRKNNNYRCKASDIISFFALMVSVLAIAFTYYDHRRQVRIDTDATDVIIQSVQMLIKETAVDSMISYQILSGLNENIRAHLTSSDEAESQRLLLIQSKDLSRLSLSPELLLLIAKSDSGAAKKIAKCLTLSSSLSLDLKEFYGASFDHLSVKQIFNANVLPYRFFKLSEACSEAEMSLTKYPTVKDPLKGTLGELQAASELEHVRKNDKNADIIFK